MLTDTRCSTLSHFLCASAAHCQRSYTAHHECGQEKDDTLLRAVHIISNIALRALLCSHGHPRSYLHREHPVPAATRPGEGIHVLQAESAQELCGRLCLGEERI